jgi:hypothetical protein
MMPWTGEVCDLKSERAPTKLNAFAADGCGQSECAPLWRGDAGPDSILEFSPTLWNGVVFIGSYGGKLYAFNAGGSGKKLCEPLWTGKMRRIESAPWSTRAWCSSAPMTAIYTPSRLKVAARPAILAEFLLWLARQRISVLVTAPLDGACS